MAEVLEHPQAAAVEPRGVGIMVSYKELVEIRTQIVGISSQLTAALALQGKVDQLDHRVQSVELALAGRAGSQNTWHTVLTFLGGVVTTAVAGGALAFLPKLMGWHP